MYTIYTLKWITGSCFSWSHPPLWTHSHGWISSLPWKHRRRAPHDEGSQSTRQNGDLEHLPLSRPGWKLMILPVFALGRCRLAPWHLGRPKKSADLGIVVVLFVSSFLRHSVCVEVWLNLVVASWCPSIFNVRVFNEIHSFTLSYRLLLSEDLLPVAY